ncbi:4'-phosphopantetheinyl transferase family protein [Thalassotalea sp. PLHSN55]|uniref:4'-phosphopantetheinyl transferase family protein n=1 Tax=Thalassotalea sp. PLHSN55 TaxID=3435888 RepID=UPI003F824D17
MENDEIFLAITSAAKQYLLLPEQLSKRELATYKHKKSTKAQQQFLASRGFIKYHLAKHFSKTTNDIELVFDYENKLIKAIHSGCFLAWVSLSHSGTHIAIAYSRSISARLGIDIECLARERDFLALAEISFSTNEQRQVAGADNLKCAFYSYWTVKEALAKATKTPLTQLFLKDSHEFLLRQGVSALTIKLKNAICTLIYPANKKLTFESIS